MVTLGPAPTSIGYPLLAQPPSGGYSLGGLSPRFGLFAIRSMLIFVIMNSDIRNLDLNLLHLLDALLELRSVSLAAQSLGMSQPSASAGLSRLRLAFGDELFVRTGRGMRPTARAEELVHPVRQLLETVSRELLHVPEFDPVATRRCFTLSMSDIGELVFLPRILRLLREHAPSASLRCVSVPHQRLEPAMEEGDVDLAVGYFPDLDGRNIFCQRLFEHPFTCLVRSDHPIIKERLTLEQFLECDHLVVNQEGRSQEIFEKFMAEQGYQRRILLHLPHFMSVPQLISESDMISIVPYSLGAKFAGTGEVRSIAPPLAIPSIPLKQFWHRRAKADPAITWLRHIIASDFINRDPYQSSARSRELSR